MKPKLLLGLALVLSGGLNFSQGADTSVARQARAFVAECLHSTNVFVLNPPADTNPYHDLSPEERMKRLQQVGLNGSMLFLYPDGLPQKFETKKLFKPDGANKSWHPKGQPAAVEQYRNGKLVAGVYCDLNGKQLGEVTNGSGRQIIFYTEAIGSPGLIRQTIEYRDGVKNGVETAYSDYAKGERTSETHFVDGKRNGLSTTWRNGHKLSEETYTNGLQDGVAIAWDASGQTNSITHFRNGQLDGLWVRYFPNGKEAEEIVYATNGIASHKTWYASGALLAEEIQGENGLAAKSYDFTGRQTGEVKAGNGTLVMDDESMTLNGASTWFHLKIFENGREIKSDILPKASLQESSLPQTSNGVAFFLEIQSTKPAKDVSVNLRLPAGVTSASPLVFASTNVPGGAGRTLGPFELKFPVSFQQWTGEIVADVSAEVDGHPVHYQTLAWHRDKSAGSLPPPSTARSNQPPRSLKTDLVFMLRGTNPKLTKGEAPSFQQAVDLWSSGDERWLLYARPALLLWSKNRGKDWQIMRKDFAYQPNGLACWPGGRILLWGTKPTKTPEHGIPFVIEQSSDGGKSWQPLKARLPVDYLLGLTVNERGLIVSGIRLPKSGLPEGKDWFELPETTLVSEDGKFFTEWAGPNFFGRGQIAEKSVAPNKTARAYLLNQSFLDQSFCLYAARSLAENPQPVAYCEQKPDIVWSGNSRIVALQTNGVFTAYGDLDNQPFTPVGFWGSSQDKDAKIKALLKANQ
jgi:antitoxin component YwqK of YwqJK toxin-antitoxin module